MIMPDFICPKQALQGKRVLVASTPKTSQRLKDGLESRGAAVRVAHVIEIRECAAKGPLDRAIDALDSYAWIVFTSSYGVHFFLRRLAQRGIRADRLSRRRLCAVGPSTAEELTKEGLRATLVPQEFLAEGIASALLFSDRGAAQLAGTRILMPRAREARDTLPRLLSDAGAQVDAVVCYENIPAQADPELIESLSSIPPDIVVFTSSLAVRSLMGMMNPRQRSDMLANVCVAAMGPATASTVESFGGKAGIVPGRSTVESLVDAIHRYFARA